MYLNPMGHSFSLRPCLAAMRSSMPVVLKARTTSPGHFLRSRSQRKSTAETLVRIDEAAIFRDGADAVRIAVHGQPGMALFFQHSLPQHFYVGLDRLRIDSGE